MAEFDEFHPERLFMERQHSAPVKVEVVPSRPAPRANFEPSDKVKAALAEILPKIEALKPVPEKEG